MLFAGATEGRRATVSAPDVLFVPLIHIIMPACEYSIYAVAVYLIFGCFLAGAGARFLAIIGAFIITYNVHTRVFVVVVCELD